MRHHAKTAAWRSLIAAIVLTVLVFVVTSTELVGSVEFPLYDPALFAGMMVGNVHSPNFAVVFAAVFLENYLICFFATFLYLLARQRFAKVD